MEVYARVLETVEVDSTSMLFRPRPPLRLAKRTPPGFTFSLTLPREITHERALGAGSAAIVEEFCERARVLEDKLACVLIPAAHSS